MYRTPLGHIRAVELASGVAVAYAARLLGDLGAEVIRVGSGRAESQVADANYNKYGCSLEPRDAESRELLSRLLARADVVLYEASGTPSPDELTTADKGLIVVTLSGSETASNAPAVGASTAAQVILALWRRRQSGTGSQLAIDVGAGAMPSARPRAIGEDGRVLAARADGSLVPVLPPHFRMSENPTSVRLPPPVPGEHDDYVLRGLLDLSETTIADLQRRGIIASAS